MFGTADGDVIIGDTLDVSVIGIIAIVGEMVVGAVSTDCSGIIVDISVLITGSPINPVFVIISPLSNVSAT